MMGHGLSGAAGESIEKLIFRCRRRERSGQPREGLQRAGIRAKPDRLTSGVSVTDEDTATRQLASVVQHLRTAAAFNRPEPDYLTRRELWSVAFNTPAVEQKLAAFTAGTRGEKPICAQVATAEVPTPRKSATSSSVSICGTVMPPVYPSVSRCAKLSTCRF